MTSAVRSIYSTRRRFLPLLQVQGCSPVGSLVTQIVHYFHGILKTDIRTMTTVVIFTSLDFPILARLTVPT